MLKSNSYKKARTYRMVVEELINETGIDLFVLDDHKKIIDENIKFPVPSLIHDAIEYIWNGTNKLSKEVKQAIEFFKFEDTVNQDGLSFVLPPDGILIDENCEEEKIDTTANWEQLLDNENSKEIEHAIYYVWGTGGLDYFEYADWVEDEIYEFECGKYDTVNSNPFTDSGSRLNPEKWGGHRSFDKITTSSIVPYS